MAVTSAGFKQQCPTCETMVLIKDMRQVGKKMECPKCKDRFVVEEPPDEEEVGKSKGNGKPAPAAKPKKRFREDDVDDEDDGAEEEAKGKGKFRDDGDDDDGAPAKKKSGGSKKTLPFILAGVGVVVLVVAAVLIIMTRGDSTPSAPPVNPNAKPNAGNNAPKEEKKEAPKTAEQPVAKNLSAAGAELTNLLPNETEHVLWVNFKDLLDGANPYRDLIFGAGVFQDDELRRKLGFSLTSLDALIRADRYTGGGWTYTVLHFTESLDGNALTAAFGLKEAPAVNNQKYYNATKPNPWFEELSRLSLGVSSGQRNLGQRPNRPLAMRLHNPQTLIVGDEAPIVALLKANSQFKLLTDLSPPAQNNAAPMGPGGMMPGGMMPGGMGPGGLPMGPGGMQPGGLPLGPGGVQPGGGGDAPQAPPKGRGAAPGGAASVGGAEGVFFSNLGGDEVFGEPQFAQVAPTIIAPPLNMQPGQSLPGMQPGGQGPMGMMPGMPGGMPGMPNQQAPAANAAVRSEAWLTIDPALKAILDRLQYKAAESKDRVMFASATDMVAARLDTSKMPEFKNRILWHPRQLWDITLLMEERKPRIKALGTGLTQRESRVFQYRTEIVCTQEAEAKDLRKGLVEKAAPQIARTLDRLLDHKIDIPKEETPAETPQGAFPGGAFGPMGLQPGGSIPPMGPIGGGSAPPMGVFGPMGVGPGGLMPGFQPGGAQQPKEEVAKASKLTITVRGDMLDIKLDLVFDAQGYARVNNLLGLLAITLKSEVDLAGAAYSRHDLAMAVKALGEKGLTDRGVAPGHYPPAALKRASPNRLDHHPSHRMSWLTGLLPHLGHSALYEKINFDVSWQDPQNWLAARSLVPQFLDPQYPDDARFTTHADLGVEMATTHVVGIAGVGLDAASYTPGDPAYSAKRGAFSYDGTVALAEIAKGRGLSNTAVTIQIPHDGVTGVNPWIAGGGATVRGVPEKNSIAPFILSTDRNGKPIVHNGKRGTYVSMADGSVRFVSEKVSDAVFQAMCTINGPKPADFDLNKNPDTPLLPKTEAKVEDRTPVAVGPKAPATNLSAEGKAFHEGIQKTFTAMQTLEAQAGLSLGKAKGNAAELDLLHKKIVADEKALLQQGRQIKAPSGKEAQEYYAAFKAILDASEESTEKDLPIFVAAMRNPSPENDAKLAQMAQANLPKQITMLKRLQDAERAFLQATPGLAPPESTSLNGLPSGWKQFSVPNVGITVGMPGNPISLDQQPVPGGPKQKVYIATELATQDVYMVTVLPMDPNVKAQFAADPDQFFRQLATKIGGASGQAPTEKSVVIGTAKGREFTLREPMSGKYMFVRAFVTNDQLIMVAAIAGNQPTQSPTVVAYFSSLKVGG